MVMKKGFQYFLFDGFREPVFGANRSTDGEELHPGVT